MNKGVAINHVIYNIIPDIEHTDIIQYNCYRSDGH